MTGLDGARRGKTDETRLGRTSLGKARQGWADRARRGGARQGEARLTGQGLARVGLAGLDGQDRAWQIDPNDEYQCPFLTTVWRRSLAGLLSSGSPSFSSRCLPDALQIQPVEVGNFLGFIVVQCAHRFIVLGPVDLALLQVQSRLGARRPYLGHVSPRILGVLVKV